MRSLWWELTGSNRRPSACKAHYITLILITKESSLFDFQSERELFVLTPAFLLIDIYTYLLTQYVKCMQDEIKRNN
jgi:hypothetical protein